MPEGPEVRRAASWILERRGDTILSAETVSGKLHRRGVPRLSEYRPGKLVDVGVLGKSIFVRTEGALTLHSTLGMSGWWYSREWLDRYLGEVIGERSYKPQYADQVKKHVRFKLTFATDELVYVDQRNFGNLRFCDDGEVQEISSKLGPDVMATDPLYLFTVISEARARKRDQHVCRLLLDQSVVSGLGNIYRAEALYLAKVNPWTWVSKLTDEECYLLAYAAAHVTAHGFYQQPIPDDLRRNFTAGNVKAVVAPQVSTTEYQTGRFYNVYQSKYDPEGNQVIARPDSGGRTVWWCPSRQGLFTSRPEDGIISPPSSQESVG